MKLAEIGIPSNNHLQTEWGMSTSPPPTLADFNNNVINISIRGE